jgi:hypothetical protein
MIPLDIVTMIGHFIRLYDGFCMLVDCVEC